MGNCSLSFIGCLILVVIVICVPLIIYKVVVKPKNPSFTLDRASITGFNLTSDAYLTAFFDVNIRANNPNYRLKLVYRDVRVSIFKDKQNIAEDALPSFTQHKRNVTYLRAQPVALNVGLKKSPVFDFERESGMGYLDFDVFMTATLNGDSLEVNCRHAIVNVTSSSVGFSADAPSMVSNHNPGKFREIGCSVYVYSNSDY